MGFRLYMPASGLILSNSYRDLSWQTTFGLLHQSDCSTIGRLAGTDRFLKGILHVLPSERKGRLVHRRCESLFGGTGARIRHRLQATAGAVRQQGASDPSLLLYRLAGIPGVLADPARSEERREGKECVSTGKSRGPPDKK